MDILVAMSHILSKSIATQGLCSKSFLLFPSIKNTSPIKIHSCSFLNQVKTQIKNCLTTSAKKPERLTSLPIGPTKNLQTPLCWQRKRLFHSTRRQCAILQETRCNNIYLGLPALNTVRTICTSPVLSSISVTPSVTQRQATVETATTVSTDNDFAVQQTPAEATVETGLNEAVNSVTETTASSSLLFPDFPIIRAAEQTIQKLHEVTGLPWWATITLTAVTLRMVLIMPLSVYAMHNAEKLSRLQPEIVEISKRLKQEVSMAMHEFKWDEKKAKDEYIKNMKRLMRELQIKNNCHPLKNTASFWLQFPLWVSVSYSLRNMTSRALSPEFDHHEECKSLTDEGTLWFPDLTMTDSTWVLPVLMGFVTLFNIEMTHLKIGEETKYRKRLTLFLRCLALAFIPISSTMPSAMVFYWVNSGFLAAMQNILHDYSPFRRLVGLGPSPFESSSPVKALMNSARQKYFNR